MSNIPFSTTLGDRSDFTIFCWFRNTSLSTVRFTMRPKTKQTWGMAHLVNPELIWSGPGVWSVLTEINILWTSYCAVGLSILDNDVVEAAFLFPGTIASFINGLLLVESKTILEEMDHGFSYQKRFAINMCCFISYFLKPNETSFSFPPLEGRRRGERERRAVWQNPFAETQYLLAPLSVSKKTLLVIKILLTLYRHLNYFCLFIFFQVAQITAFQQCLAQLILATDVMSVILLPECVKNVLYTVSWLSNNASSNPNC